MDRDIAVMLCGHGSRDDTAVAEFANLAERIRQRLPHNAVEHGYLEFATPVIRDGLDSLYARGFRRIVAIPGMLFAAGHTKNDIPSVLNQWAAEHPDVELMVGRELAIDLRMIRAAGARVAQALRDAGAADDPHNTLLVTVGRGASDPDANANVAKVTRLLWEGLGLGWAETAYSGVTFPLVAPALRHVARLGYQRIVVFPYFLFTGILVRRIYEHTDAVAAEHPGIAFVKAGYLNDHDLVVDTVVDRIDEAVNGRAVMNCSLCKYREAMLGFEDQVGLPQTSHHHHVEGIGTGGDGHQHHGHHDHDHRHDGHDHRHGSDDHHHHPYPHADHPLGPRSLGSAGH